MEGTLSFAMSWGKAFINKSASPKSFQIQPKLVDLQRHTENDINCTFVKMVLLQISGLCFRKALLSKLDYNVVLMIFPEEEE